MALYLPRSTFDIILQHLVAVEDEREFLLAACFPESGEERERFRELFERYTLRMNELIRQVKVAEDKDGGLPVNPELPFVMVGSEVTVEELAQSERLVYRVQHPFKTDGDNEISYISTLGAALLLKEPGQKVTVETSAGEYACRIEVIRLFPALIPRTKERSLPGSSPEPAGR